MKRIILTLAIMAILSPLSGKWHDCKPTWGGQRCLDHSGHPWIVCPAGWRLNPQTLTCSAVQS